MDQLKQFAKRIPGLRPLYHFLNDLRIAAVHGKGLGRWLYLQQTVQWMRRPDLRRQLPLPYRLFSLWCILQQPLQIPRIVCGATAFEFVRFLQRLFSRVDHIVLNLGCCQVALNLMDPRMLQVPNELLSPESDAMMVRQFIGAGDTFLDIGANHGSFAIFAAGFVGAKGLVVAVEPQPRLAALVEMSLAANARAPYQVLPIACGDRMGEIELWVPTQTSGNASLFASYAGKEKAQRFVVPLKRFDDAIDWKKFPGRVFMKLDIEGSELAFLRGASEFLRARQPGILLEINPTSMKAAGTSVAQIGQLLREFGYQRFVWLGETKITQLLCELSDAHCGNIIVTV